MILNYNHLVTTILVYSLCLVSCHPGEPEPPSNEYPLKVIELDPEKAVDLAKKIRQEVNLEVDDKLEVSLWASDSLIHDPIAISVDPTGRIFYTRATRQSNSEFDIRGHRDWMTASISFQSVEDRRAFLRKTFSETNEEGQRSLKDLNEDGILDWRDLTVEKEQVWFVADRSGNGVADRAQLYLEDFNEEITDVANGIEFANGEVYIAVGPDLWRTKDTDGDGRSDEKSSLSHGYAIHIGFSGHGMSGAKMGPDGRIWWGIGDIGMNVVDKEGKQWKYPNRGVIVRSEPDGSNFEVFASGVRNTHEFDFDKYGNLITVDNDGDHAGERERLVYLIDGSETGWRINWQFGKYTDPDNNEYKVWMDEKMHVPHWEGQAAYFLPPIQNYVNGPTGLVYNPGTALGESWKAHFFVAEFRGSPANSPIHAFTMEPVGASFKLGTTKEIVKGILPTGLDFGPDGALYAGDWIDGWGTKDAGRIWKIDVKTEKPEIRAATRLLIQADFAPLTVAELTGHLSHPDMRIRQKAQFELVRRGDEGYNALLAAAQTGADQLARIHGIWGIGQLARQGKLEYVTPLMDLLADADEEIIAQAARIMGDVRYAGAGEKLIQLLSHSSLRIQMLATEALGRTGEKSATRSILEMLERNDNRDLWLRHAGMIALGRIGDEAALAAESGHASAARRVAAVVALRRMESPEVARFLNDADEYIVTEAARAINDDFSIEAALSDLAKVLADKRFRNEALLRRAINANLRVGKQENIDRLAAFAADLSAPPAMRAEALHTLATWAKPSVFDRVDGRYRGELTRDAAPVKAALQPQIAALLKQQQPEVLMAAAKATGRLKLTDHAPRVMNLLKNHPSAEVRETALRVLHELNTPSLETALEIAIADKDKAVRSAALEILPESQITTEKSIELFTQVLKTGSIVEQQAAISSIGKMKSQSATVLLGQALDQLLAGNADPAVQLDIIEAVTEQNDPGLMSRLDTYQAVKSAVDSLALYRETLAGGDAARGRRLFYRHEGAQCVRCHAVFEYGGNAGPGLAGVGDRLTREQLLESLVAPSAVLAPGYGVVILETKSGETISGIVLEESAEEIRLKIGKEDIRVVAKSDISSRENIPSSMPDMREVLTKKEIRDLVEFLAGLRMEG